jgi:hypothetical protein
MASLSEALRETNRRAILRSGKAEVADMAKPCSKKRNEAGRVAKAVPRRRECGTPVLS